jgi:predicted CXXCH cytochrome family protein
MLTKMTRRTIFGLCFAVIAVLLATTVEAGPTTQEGPVRTDCNECHATVVNNWEESAHGQAYDSATFQEAWQEQGSPGECLTCHTTGYDAVTGEWRHDNIACETCHSGQTGPHPEVVMPTDSSSRLCGTCHVDTYNEWEVSEHGKNNMTCVKCHNPHTAEVKVADVQALCATCHNEEGYYYDYAAHSREGVECTDCHLQIMDSTVGEGHGQRKHTFGVDLATCTECHGNEMHFPSQAEANSAEPADFMWAPYAAPDTPGSSGGTRSCPDTGAVVNAVPSPAPEQTKPFNYLLIAAVGMAFGIALAPWAEGWYRRFAKHHSDEV